MIYGVEMKKKYLIILFTMTMMVFAGYMINHPHFDTYEQRHRAGFDNMARKDYSLAQWCFEQCVKKEPDRLDGYTCLIWFYSSIGESEKSREMLQLTKDAGFAPQLIDQVDTAYRKLGKYNAAYLTNTNNSLFTYYNTDDTVVATYEKDGDDYKYTSYHYDENGVLTRSYVEGRETVVTTYYDSQKGISHYTTYDNTKENIEYIYDEQGRLIQVKSDKKPDQYLYYDGIGQIKKIEHKNSLERIEYIEYFDNGLIQTDYFNYNQNLTRQEFFDPDGKLKKIIFYGLYNNIKSYVEYTYAETAAGDVTICKTYSYDGRLIKSDTTIKYADYDSVKTEHYNSKGEVVKTVTGSKTQRASDNITNSRPLSQQEIDYINTYHQPLSLFLGGYETAENAPLDSILEKLPADDVLDFYKLDELNDLREEKIFASLKTVDIDFYQSKKIYFDTVNSLTEKYMNISPLEMYDMSVVGYSRKYNSFYTDNEMRNVRPAEIPQLNCLGGVVGDNYRKLYTEQYTMVFEKQGDNYYLTACYGEDHSDLAKNGISSPQPTPQPQQEKREYYWQFRENIIPAGTPRADVYNKFIYEYMNQFGNIDYYINNEENVCWLWYALYDITKDGLPELFLQEGVGIPVSVYTYKDGQVVRLDNSFGNNHHGPSYIIKSGMTANRKSTTDVTYFFTKYYPDGSTESFRFCYGWHGSSIDYFSINGEQVTREEYIEFARPYLTAFYTDSIQIGYAPVADKIYK
ncbi:MAG: hypothetical protein IJ362_08245 [Oscillospiraceae bacterium]|nr:hypothetical protein [Oscillospiraceae bacterium]